MMCSLIPAANDIKAEMNLRVSTMQLGILVVKFLIDLAKYFGGMTLN
jgi:hypothetical protein